MSRREFPRKVRFEIMKRASDEKLGLICEGCGLALGSKSWHIDHTIPDALAIDKSAALTAADGKLLGWDCCHKPKTAKDQGDIAKSNRRTSKIRYGEKKPSRFPKPPPGSRWDWKLGRRTMA